MAAPVRVEFFGPVKSPTGRRRMEVEVGEGETVGRILVGRIGFREEDLRHLAVIQNGKRLGRADRVRPGSVIEVILPTGGG